MEFPQVLHVVVAIVLVAVVESLPVLPGQIANQDPLNRGLFGSFGGDPFSPFSSNYQSQFQQPPMQHFYPFGNDGSLGNPSAFGGLPPQERSPMIRGPDSFNPFGGFSSFGSQSGLGNNPFSGGFDKPFDSLLNSGPFLRQGVGVGGVGGEYNRPLDSLLQNASSNQNNSNFALRSEAKDHQAVSSASASATSDGIVQRSLDTNAALASAAPSAAAVAAAAVSNLPTATKQK